MGNSCETTKQKAVASGCSAPAAQHRTTSTHKGVKGPCLGQQVVWAHNSGGHDMLRHGRQNRDAAAVATSAMPGAKSTSTAKQSGQLPAISASPKEQCGRARRQKAPFKGRAEEKRKGEDGGKGRRERKRRGQRERTRNNVKQGKENYWKVTS